MSEIREYLIKVCKVYFETLKQEINDTTDISKLKSLNDKISNELNHKNLIYILDVVDEHIKYLRNDFSYRALVKINEIEELRTWSKKIASINIENRISIVDFFMLYHSFLICQLKPLNIPIIQYDMMQLFNKINNIEYIQREYSDAFLEGYTKGMENKYFQPELPTSTNMFEKSKEAIKLGFHDIEEPIQICFQFVEYIKDRFKNGPGKLTITTKIGNQIVLRNIKELMFILNSKIFQDAFNLLEITIDFTDI